MEIVIKGEPKEIAALVVAIQERLSDEGQECPTSEPSATHPYKAGDIPIFTAHYLKAFHGKYDQSP